MLAYRSLSFTVEWDDSRLDWLLAEFRLLVNESIRIALQGDHRSRARLSRAAYGYLSARHVVHKQYIPSAFEVALAALKVYRRRIQKGKSATAPFMRRLMLKAENQAYQFDRETGRLRVPLHGTEGVQLNLTLSDWHRSFLLDPSWGLGSLTVVPGKVIIVVRKETPKPYDANAALALDTNEDSLDGIIVDGGISRPQCPLGASGASRRSTSKNDGGSRGRKRTIAGSNGFSSNGTARESGTASASDSTESRRWLYVLQKRAGPQ